MTDEEVICRWMEPTIPVAHAGSQFYTKGGWWICSVDETHGWAPVVLTLDRLHEVEARLSDEQWKQYAQSLAKQANAGDVSAFYFSELKAFIHAIAKQRIAAIASVLRPSCCQKHRELGYDDKGFCLGAVVNK